MDLILRAKEKLERVGPGEHVVGLNAVLLHIETAVAHLDRGQEQADDTAFTDAIYRTNQAFEGALKEAYRVIAEENPEKKTPYEIERFFADEDFLRPRVLEQLKRYRQDWRNPSTHDYKLDFDSSEALLAIFSVGAFAVLLLDQIIEHMAREKARMTAKKEDLLTDEEDVADGDSAGDSLQREVARILQSYVLKPRMGDRPRPSSEYELLGSIAGSIESLIQNSTVKVGGRLDGDENHQIDILVQKGDSSVIIEVKNGARSEAAINSAEGLFDHYKRITGISHFILLTVIDAMRINKETRNTTEGSKVLVIEDRIFVKE